MLPSQLNGSPKRANPFGRKSPSGSPGPQSGSARPKSAVLASQSKFEAPKGHWRNSASVAQLTPTPLSPQGERDRSNSLRNNATTGTFAPEFIKSEELRRGADQIRGLEGDNDFSGNKYVWLRDPEKAFVRGLVLDEDDGGRLLVETDDGDVWPTGYCNMVVFADILYSNERLMRTKSTKSILPSSTKRTIWRSSRT